MVDADEPRNGRVCDRCPLFTLRHMVPDFIAEDPQQRYRGPWSSCAKLFAVAFQRMQYH